MPKREASKCREWERERRERLKTCFDALAKLLPNHDPAIVPSKLEILQRAAAYITDLQQKNKELENDDPQVTVAQRDETRKLRDRVRRLSSRAEQLAGLLRAAGLRIPKECNGIVFKGPPRLWSGKICREKAELLKKQHEEDPKTGDNTPADKTPSKKKRKRVASPSKKTLTLSENGLILGPVLKKLTLTTNSTTVKVLSSRTTRRQNANTRVSTTTSTTNGVAARVGAVLGPGTLILADGSVVPVPAPRAAPPATLHRIQLLPVTTASSSPVILMQRNITTGNSESNLRHPPIRPKTALCRLNRGNMIAKIPIPTLRSSRAVISRKKVIQQRKIDQKASKVNLVKKKSLETTEASKSVVESKKTTETSSNKMSDSNKTVINKKVDDTVEQNNKLSIQDKNKVKHIKSIDQDILQNKENTNKVEGITKIAKTDVKNIEVTSVVITTAEMSNLQKGVKEDKKTDKMINNPEEKQSSKTYTEPCKNIQSSAPLITEIVPNKSKMITPELKPDTSASDIQKEFDNLSEKAKNQQHCQHQDNQQILQENEEKIVQVQNEPQQQPEENNQITDLNHQELQPQQHQPESHQDEHHSELSNDIFASLQDGAGAGVIGGQHTESMSPTAAFLLAFPLVSTLTGGGRVNDGPNTHGSTNGDGRIINGSSNGNASGNNGSDDDGGRQGTPTTLLQIGGTISLDNGGNSGNGQNKQRHIQLTNDEVPRALDNFSFFTKEPQPYNTNRDHVVSTSLEPTISHACLYEQQVTHVSNPTEPAALPNISYYTDASVAFSNNPFTELRPQTEHQPSNQHNSGYNCLAKEKNSGGKQRMNKNQQQQQQYRAPVNWMTSPDVRPTYTHQHYQHASTSSSFNTSDYFLPPFSDVYGNNSSLDHNLSAEHPPFTWSPTAGRSALPTLIGDLALGVTNSHNLEPNQQMDASAKDNSGASAPFLSVSSLVNGNKQRKQSSSQQSAKRHREKTTKNRVNNQPNNPPTMINNPNTHSSTQNTPINSIVTNSSLLPLVPSHNAVYSGASSSGTNNLKRSDNQRHINPNNNNNNNNTVNPFMDNINNSVGKRSANISYLENMKRSDNNTLYTANNNAINSGNPNNSAIGMNAVNTSVKRNDNTYHLDNNMLKRTDHTSYNDVSVHNNSVNGKRTNNTYIDNTVNTALKSIRNFLDNSVKQSDNSFIDNSVKKPGSSSNSYLDNTLKRSDNSFIDNTIKRSENYLENTVKRTDNSYLDTSASNVKRSVAGGYSAEALIASNNSTIQQQNNHHQTMYSSYDQRNSSYTLPPGGVTGSNNCTIGPNTQHHQSQNQHHYQQQIPHQQQIQPPHQPTHQQHRNNVHPFHVNQNIRHPINNNTNNSGSNNNNQQNIQHQSVHHQHNQHLNINMSASASLTSSSFAAQPVSISSSAPAPSSLMTAAPSFGHMPSTVVTTASIAPSYVTAPSLGAPPREFSALLSAAVVDTYSKPFDSFVHVKPPVPVPPPPLVATTLTMTTATTSISTPGSFDSYCASNTHSSRPHMGNNDNTDRRRHSSRRSNNNTSNTNNNINSSSTAGPFAELNFLSMTGSVNSPLLQDDFHAAPFLSNALPVPPVPPPMPPSGSSLTNFNVSAIFPEINKATASLPVTTWPSTKPSSSSSRSHARYHQHNQIMHSHNHHPQGHTQHPQQHRNNSDHTGQTNSSGYRQHGHQNQHSTHQQFTPDPMYSVAGHSSAANTNIMPHHQVQPFPSSTSATLPTGALDVPSAAPPSTFSFSFTTP